MTAGAIPAAGSRVEARATAWTGEILPLLGIAGQLALVLLVIQRFELESTRFYHTMLTAAAGFVVNAVLPLRFRLPWFAVVSLAGIGVAFGAAGLWIVAVGLGLIALMHLPVRWTVRLGLVLAAGAVLALARIGVLPTPWPSAVWPMLGSMFLFRIIVYMHALKHEQIRPSAATLGYFFMLPNVPFLIFPVVDWQKFVKGHFAGDAIETYQTGLRWIVRGLVQLLAYRYIYYYLVLDPSQITGLADFLQYALANFGLFLRITGSYHVIAGVLGLFGFNLPETTHRFLLSSSFTDFWRRMYIYWKDFMSKVVYYPVYFAARKHPTRTRLLTGLVVVFFATWLLHAWQWFWLRGDLPFTVVDTLFWTLMGVGVVIATLRESGGARKASPPGWNLSRAVNINLFFWTITLLLAFWYSGTLGAWWATLQAAAHVSGRDLLMAGGLLGLGLFLAGWNWDAPNLAGGRPRFWYRYPAMQNAATLALILAASSPAVIEQVGGRTGEVMTSMRQNVLNARDQRLMTRGYYEQLENVGQGNSRVWEVDVERPADWIRLEQTAAYHPRDDFMLDDLTPSVRITFKNAPFSTNRWGMRDRDYTREKPAGVRRMALLGPSDVMGSGVADGETFENVLEDRLNRLHGAPGRRYEILNFAIAGHSLLQYLEMLRTRALDFQPDMVVVTNHVEDRGFVFRQLGAVVKRGIPIPYPEIQAIVERAGVTAETETDEAIRRLTPLMPELEAWTLGKIAELSRQAGAMPVFAAIRIPTGAPPDTALARMAAEAGFEVIDLTQAYQGGPETDFMIAEFDKHPNVAGHQAIAEAFYQALRERRQALRLDDLEP